MVQFSTILLRFVKFLLKFKVISFIIWNALELTYLSIIFHYTYCEAMPQTLINFIRYICCACWLFLRWSPCLGSSGKFLRMKYRWRFPRDTALKSMDKLLNNYGKIVNYVLVNYDYDGSKDGNDVDAPYDVFDDHYIHFSSKTFEWTYCHLSDSKGMTWI